jgi:hypothetical protein
MDPAAVAEAAALGAQTPAASSINTRPVLLSPHTKAQFTYARVRACEVPYSKDGGFSLRDTSKKSNVLAGWLAGWLDLKPGTESAGTRTFQSTVILSCLTMSEKCQHKNVRIVVIGFENVWCWRSSLGHKNVQ